MTPVDKVKLQCFNKSESNTEYYKLVSLAVKPFANQYKLYLSVYSNEDVTGPGRVNALLRQPKSKAN